MGLTQMSERPKEKSPFQGRVQVYTGDGKGKTTAALGLALRAAGYGFRTYIAQFLKGRPSGEHAAAARLAPLVTIERFGRSEFVNITDKGPEEEDTERARRALRAAEAAMLSGRYRIVVLDEVNVAVDLGILPEKELLEFLDRRPESVELVLTGRGAPASVLERADLVTEMKNVRHYHERGVKAREGIER
jgi:cob(I)alamin adenosyltransferase